MNITPTTMKVRDVIAGFVEDNATNSVTSMDGKLIVRPEYQRQFVYTPKESGAVIRTVLNGFPLGLMYFARVADTDTYEVLDGQQRIISLGRFAREKGSDSVLIPDATGSGFNATNFNGLFDESKQAILDYELTVYVCEGTEKEKLSWFEVINIAGKELTKQELRSAIYHGPWVTDAKSAFVRHGCAAYKSWRKYLSGKMDRQYWLETAISWAANADGVTGKDAVDVYMQDHRNDKNADELWKYFEMVMRWATSVFTTYRNEMKGQPWGELYEAHHEKYRDAAKMEERVKELMSDDEVTSKRGIYAYVLDGDERHLNLRQFTTAQKREMYERQKGVCPLCGKHYAFEDMDGDHVTPWCRGGKTEVSNGQMLCRKCNHHKSDK